MATWGEFSTSNPEMAAFASDRLNGTVAYLATVRKDGSPRVHPVTPIIGKGRLFLFMEPTSPKGYDIRRNGRYAIHCSVTDAHGGGGECVVTGEGQLVNDNPTRKLAIAESSYTPEERYVLFELGVDSVLTTVYEEGVPVRNRWSQGGE